MRFARWVFLIAGLYGLVVIVPQFFLEERIGRDQPPAITHPEHFYGFLAVCTAFQVLFLVIARDPARLRPVMPVAVLEKVGAVAFVVLVVQGRAPPMLLGFAAIDFLFLVLFAIAYARTARA